MFRALSVDEPNDLFSIVKRLKSFNGLAELSKSKGLGENPEITIVISCSFIIRRYTRKFKISIERANLQLNLLDFVEIRLESVSVSWKEKQDSGY